MTVSTIYCYSPGWTYSHNHEQGESWATAHDATTTSNYGADTAVGTSVYHGSGSNSYDIYRRTILFDTSSIPATATIHSAVFNAYRKKEWAPMGGPYVYLCPVSDSGGGGGGYYNQAYFGAAVATLTATGESDNVNTWWQPSIAPSSIVKEGSTFFGFRTWHDYNNSAPGTENNTNQFYFAPTNDATYKPYLTITWTTPPTVTTGSVTDLESTTATLGGNVTGVGGGTVSERGVCWSTSANPTTSNSKQSAAGSTGAFTVGATGLVANTLYHYRAYVITENSTQYGSDQTFSTDNTPTVESVAISSIRMTSFASGGNVTSDGGDGILERGIVVATHPSPTTSDLKFTTAGTTGAYATNATGLIPGKLYYVRAFARNDVGTSYSGETTVRVRTGASLMGFLFK